MAKERSCKIALEYPITWEGGSASEVVVNRPKVRDLRALDEVIADSTRDFDTAVALASTLTNLPAAAIEDMDSEDFQKVSEAIAVFFPQGKVPMNGVA